ncbi:MAG: hypothetical protein ABW133_11560, partial [Polyangiaceae bacterium]
MAAHLGKSHGAVLPSSFFTFALAGLTRNARVRDQPPRRTRPDERIRISKVRRLAARASSASYATRDLRAAALTAR